MGVLSLGIASVSRTLAGFNGTRGLTGMFKSIYNLSEVSVCGYFRLRRDPLACHRRARGLAAQGPAPNQNGIRNSRIQCLHKFMPTA